MPDPITPTRIIPPGAPLPAPAAPTPPPPPLPAGPPPTPGPLIVRHVHQILLVPPAPEPTWWDRIRALLGRVGRPWQALLGLALAVTPVLPGGYSLATTWWWCVAQTRHYHGALPAYSLALGAVLTTGTLLTRRPTVTRLTLLAITTVGALGAVRLFDPITALTGVS